MNLAVRHTHKNKIQIYDFGFRVDQKQNLINPNLFAEH